MGGLRRPFNGLERRPSAAMKIDIFPHIFPRAYYERMLAM
jgi:hypothetical protein